jgi:ATP-dependent RNA helicase DDX52/ROK1
MEAALRTLTAGVKLKMQSTPLAVVPFAFPPAPAARGAKRPRAPSVPPSAAPAAPDVNSDSDSGEGGATLDLFSRGPGGAPLPSSAGAASTASGAHAAAAATAGDASSGAASLRKHLGLRVSGLSLPPPALTFEAALPSALPAELLPWLSSSCGVPPAALAAGHGAARAALLRAVEASRYKEPTAVQMQALPALLGGRDVIAAAPTGSGKTAAFLLPLLLLLQRPPAPGAPGARAPRALVLVPTRELAAQTAREAARLGAGLRLRALALSQEAASSAVGRRVAPAESAGDLLKRARGVGEARGAATAVEGDDVLHWTDDEEEATEGRGGEVGSAGADGGGGGGGGGGPFVVAPLPRCDILVSTPLLLVALLRTVSGSGGARAVLPSLQHLVLDEVDHLLAEGFQAQLDEVLAALPTPEVLGALGLPRGSGGGCHCSVQRALFTATLPSGTEALALSLLRNPVRVVAGRAGAAAPAVAQRLLFVGREEGKALALRSLLAGGVTPPVLVFVQSKARAEQVARLLELEGARVGCMHGDLAPGARAAAVTAFRRGDTMFLVTSDVLARGVDFKGVNLVVNFDVPASATDYVHRVGRTGRAGRVGEAVTLYTEADAPLLRSIANVMRESGCAVPEWMLQLKKMSAAARKRAATAAPERRDVLTKAHARRGAKKGRASAPRAGT